MAAFTIRVRDDTAKKLEIIAQKIDRSRSYTAAEAIEEYVERQEWQLAEIEAGLAEADAGNFASPDELASVVAKYVKPSRNS
ncbi:CopG family ribbon-helix-helix protein [Mesorhizobium comanense]|uniref:CopG family ribbon-helix-helix protein n=1 Tax=Mesorhizobium comanense TaxID=2502215 RepID=UPI0010F49C23|nr:CopG family ribbon-helix-helix protein [Mesorhizobium comanense]